MVKKKKKTRARQKSESNFRYNLEKNLQGIIAFANGYGFLLAGIVCFTFNTKGESDVL